MITASVARHPLRPHWMKRLCNKLYLPRMTGSGCAMIGGVVDTHCEKRLQNHFL
jgi:hypothetical protein